MTDIRLIQLPPIKQAPVILPKAEVLIPTIQPIVEIETSSTPQANGNAVTIALVIGALALIGIAYLHFKFKEEDQVKN